MTKSIDDLCIWNKSATTKQAENIKDDKHPLYVCKTCPNPYEPTCINYQSYNLWRLDKYVELTAQALDLLKQIEDSRK